MFETHYGTQPNVDRLAWRHVASTHKMSKEWSKIMDDDRSWSSTSRLSFRTSLASWHWIRSRRDMDPALRPAVGLAQYSLLLPFKRLIAHGADVYICLQNAVWGALVFLGCKHGALKCIYTKVQGMISFDIWVWLGHPQRVVLHASVLVFAVQHHRMIVWSHDFTFV